MSASRALRYISSVVDAVRSTGFANEAKGRASFSTVLSVSVESAVSSRNTKYVTIVPGKKSVEQAAKEISEMLGVDAMDVAKVLPTRGVEIENTP